MIASRDAEAEAETTAVVGRCRSAAELLDTWLTDNRRNPRVMDEDNMAFVRIAC